MAHFTRVSAAMGSSGMKHHELHEASIRPLLEVLSSLSSLVVPSIPCGKDKSMPQSVRVVQTQTERQLMVVVLVAGNPGQ